jgi:hypothetical protein
MEEEADFEGEVSLLDVAQSTLREIDDTSFMHDGAPSPLSSASHVQRQFQRAHSR